MLGLYGGADPGIPLDTVEQMRARIKQAGGRSEIVVYPDAPHAFHADYRPSYRAEPAQDGWRRMPGLVPPQRRGLIRAKARAAFYKEDLLGPLQAAQ